MNILNNKQERHVIFLTGTINPNIFKTDEKKINVALVDEKTRLMQYENAIESYIMKSAFTDIVFVENSGYPFDYKKYEKMAQNVGKRFEFLYVNLTFSDIELMLQKGKSYGEALLIDYAMENSILIKNCDEVYKVTGRIFVNNSHHIISSAHYGYSEFILNNPKKMINRKKFFDYCGWIHTEFFKITKADYEKVFKNSKVFCNDYEVNQIAKNSKMDKIGGCIEQVWYLLALSSGVKFKNFGCFPDYQGVVGSRVGVRYGEPKSHLIFKTFLCKLGYYSL